jgi:radical SAM protein with 4Fe4S-binding SPASM domain
MYPFDRQFLRTITPARIWNLLHVAISHLLARFFGMVTLHGKPPALSIEPTNHCNLRCPQCPTGERSLTRPAGFMEPALFRQIIDDTHRELLFLLLYFQGEPFLHSSLCEMIRYARDHNIYTATSTNGHFLRDEAAAQAVVDSGLNVLIVSLDGPDQESYAHYRQGGKLEMVLDGIQRLMAARDAAGSTMKVYLQCLVFRHIEHRLDEIRHIADELGIDRLLLKSAQIYEHTPDIASWLPENSRYRRYTDTNGQLTLQGDFTRGCSKLWTSPVVTFDGQVVPCCFDKDADHASGTVTDTIPFTRIWNSDNNLAFRQRLVQNRMDIPMCRNCTEGVRIFRGS